MEHCQLILKNQVTELDVIVAKLESLAELWNIPPKVVMELNLALEELFTNVVFYAYDDQDPHTITVDFTLTDNHSIALKLEDDGKPFNLLDKDTSSIADTPLEERKIGGLGIHFVREMMTNVDYARDGNRNIVTLIKSY